MLAESAVCGLQEEGSPPAVQAAVPEAAEAAAAAAGPGASKAQPPAAQRSGPRKQQQPLSEEELAAEWESAIARFKDSEILSSKVVRCNQAGVNVRVGKLLGFVPYKLLDPARLPADARNIKQGHPQEGYKNLLGKQLKFKIAQINVPERRLVCSERAAMLDELAGRVKPGDVLEGRVTAIRDFGAFLEVKPQEDAEAYGPEVLLPLREISWDWIPNTAAALKLGDVLTAVVTNLQAPPKTKVYVSLKRLQEDPLRQTLDKVMPLDSAEAKSAPTSVPSGVEDILDELSKEEGVAQVTLGRQAVSAGTVSQDLELWLTKEEVPGGFNLVARAGRVVQEIHVSTQLDKEAMKQTVQRVLGRLA
ncbi:hypothetical protein N2152v2_001340 [Parachlorella kessleri]